MSRSIGALDVAFIPLYDHTGTIQLTCLSREWKEILSCLKTESVVKARGVVMERPEKDRNKVCQYFILLILLIIDV